MTRIMPTVWILLLATVTSAAEVVTNGSFEEVSPQGLPARWSPVGNRVELCSDAHSGRHSLRMVRTADTETAETGVNDALDREHPKPLKGGFDFWYMAVSAKGAKLNVYAIPMTDEPLERTGSSRATFTVPEGHLGDGRWHRARLKYDFTGDPKVKLVHFAARIVGSAGELLLDDISYVERVGALLEFRRVDLEEDPQRPGERGTLRATLENKGDEPAGNVFASLTAPAGLTPSPAQLPLGPLTPDATATAVWSLEGARSQASELRLSARSGDTSAETVLKIAPRLEIHSFGPVSPVAAIGRQTFVECVLKNPGNAILVKPRAEFTLPTGSVVQAVDRIAPGATVVLRAELRPSQQAPATPLAVRVAAENVAEQPSAKSVLVVGADTRLPEPSGQLLAAVTRDWALLENKNLRLAFRRNQFGFGPGEISLRTPAGWKTVAWLPRLGRVVMQQTDGWRVDTAVHTGHPLGTRQSDPVGLRFPWTGPAGCKLAVTFELGSDDKVISADYELTSDSPQQLVALEGPMIYVLDRQEAVLPGLEWLVDDEVSSSTLDIAEDHPDRIRYAVHPNMIAIPAIGVHTRAGTVGLLWDIHQQWDGQRDRPSAVFASPDRFENHRSHLMGLFLPTVPEFVDEDQREAARPYPMRPGAPLRLTCEIYADGEADDALAAIDQWIDLFGLPEPAPLPHGSYEKEVEFSMRAYLDSLWVPEEQQWWTTKGGGVLSDKGRPRTFVADLLIGALLSPDENVRKACRARADEVLALMGGEPRLDAQRLGEQADMALANPGEAAGLLASRGNDGAWRFDADQKRGVPFAGMDYHELGPDNAVELGTCARNAFVVLRYARIAGDHDAYQRMVPTLERMEQFRVPRAAQVWEVPVHTPDILAAADAVDAYLEAYRISGEPRWLRNAVTWARRGLPFLYLWDDPQKPFLRGASTPVFGATWYRGSWFGRPVQWNGLRYANALLDLAEHDRSYPWRQIAETVVRSAIHQQDLEGENVALWPDNISAIDSAKCDWVFGPRMILSAVLKLIGRPEDPQTLILGEGDRRIPITTIGQIRNGAWEHGTLRFDVVYPAGEQGVVLVSNLSRPERVLLDGKPVSQRSDLEIGAEPGWRYDQGHAWLAVRVPREGRTEVRLEGIQHRTLARLPQLAERIAFEFDGSAEGFIAAHDLTEMLAHEGVLQGIISGTDPYLIRTMLRVDAASAPVLRIRMRSTAGGGGQFFWTTESSPAFAEDRSIRFAVQPDGQFHEYRLEPGNHPAWAGQTITGLRIDPAGGTSSGEMGIDYLHAEP